ncbi:MAG: DUF4132 domain-containing protein [Marinisporobacter sp.]|jgi:hypothetical protein|nr:DUF4132 domain-containing protein [Marinisporobacter sp.]
MFDFHLISNLFKKKKVERDYNIMFHFYGVPKEIAENYSEYIEKNKKILKTKEQINFLDEIISFFKKGGRGDYAGYLEGKLNEKFPNKEIITVDELFPKEIHPVFKLLLGDELKEKFLEAVYNQIKYPYTKGYYRRPIRSQDIRSHLSSIKYLLELFMFYKASATHLEAHIKGELDYSVDYKDWLAVEIDNNNQKIIDLIKEIILGDNNVAKVSYEMIRGIVRSSNEKLHKLLGELLLAAKLQEGIRQSICESMDSGTIEAFKYLFNIVDSENLIRFSSVKRAVGTWTGIGEENGDRITKKEMILIKNALESIEFREKLLTSKDNVELYMGLWAVGFYNVLDATKVIENIIDNGERHQKLLVSYYLIHTQENHIQNRIANKIFIEYHDDYEVLACFNDCYLNEISNYNFELIEKDIIKYFESKEEANKHFNNLISIIDNMDKKVLTYNPCIFPWHEEKLKKEDVARKLCYIAMLLKEDKIDSACEYFDNIDPWSRDRFVKKLLDEPSTNKQKDTLVSMLSNRSEGTRHVAFKIADKMNLVNEYYMEIENMLRLKAGDLRSNVINLLIKQNDDALFETISRLIAEKNASKRLGALDIILKLLDDENRQSLFEKSRELVKDINEPISSEEILIKQIFGSDDKDENSMENGFGIYNNEYMADFYKKFEISKTDANIKWIFTLKEKDYLDIFEKLNNLYKENEDREYTTRYGEQTMLSSGLTSIRYTAYNKEKLNDYPFPELWTEFYKKEIKDFETLYQLYMMLQVGIYDKEEDTNKLMVFWDNFVGISLSKIKKKVFDLEYKYYITRIVEVLYREYKDKSYTFKTSVSIYSKLVSQYTLEDMTMRRKRYSWSKDHDETELVSILHDSWFRTLNKELECLSDDKDFMISFSLRYKLYDIFNFNAKKDDLHEDTNLIDLLEFSRAIKLGIIEKDELYKEVFERNKLLRSVDFISSILTGDFKRFNIDENKINKEDLNILNKNGNIIIQKIVDVELNRGDTPTIFSKVISRIKSVKGLENMVQILLALNTEKLDRSSYSGDTKKSTLSHLLHVSSPNKEDDAKKLKKLIKDKNISKERLVEVAMYSHKWIDMIQEYLGWKGFSSGCYYFMAHMSNVNEKQSALFAKFTPIAIEDLSLGAFDISWFKSAYKELGKKKFEVLYDAAKYISDGTKHSRARMFADAVNGKIKIKQAEEKIIDKRNKDLVMSYGLIPLGKNREKALLTRYKFLQNFLKESKQFGAQRRASEAKAVSISMENLARNAGFSDVTRLTLNMEASLMKEMKPYFNPHDIEGTLVNIEVDESGQSKIIAVKGDKILKSIPAKLKKHKYILTLKDIHKNLKEQHSRSKKMLEQSMEDEVLFYPSEIENLMINPVTKPLMEFLVLKLDNTFGFYRDGKLLCADGAEVELSEGSTIRIAHCFDLYNSGKWSDYQKYLFDNGIKQPFKQVFRELYVKTSEEKEKLNSRRYAGHQIQPKKTVAVLKNRRWVVDNEEGLQKVYYNENIIARIYALADWFSPSDIESPTLEWVEFSDRKTFKPIKIDEIPDIVFSEVMRDVDLAVSVAYVGGVDPETSHSTIEMRKAIGKLSAKLFKLDNIAFNESHAMIEGSLGNYTVHLGSGVIHQRAGAQINVLPVHSQHRGRLFLPFVDEDPKTAEILSKILLFAEDKKIKDPFILEQIK